MANGKAQLPNTSIGILIMLLTGLIYGESQPIRIPFVAVIPPSNNGIDSSIAPLVSDLLADEMMKTKRVRVMERSQMNTILREQNFQQSGACDGSECAVEIGRILSIDHMAVGTIGKIGDSYSIIFRLVNVETGEVIASSHRITNEKIDRSINGVIAEVADELTSPFAAIANRGSESRENNTNGIKQKTPPPPQRRHFTVEASIIQCKPSFDSTTSNQTPSHTLPYEAKIGYGFRVSTAFNHSYTSQLHENFSLSYTLSTWEYSDSSESFKSHFKMRTHQISAGTELSYSLPHSFEPICGLAYNASIHTDVEGSESYRAIDGTINTNSRVGYYGGLTTTISYQVGMRYSVKPTLSLHARYIQDIAEVGFDRGVSSRYITVGFGYDFG